MTPAPLEEALQLGPATLEVSHFAQGVAFASAARRRARIHSRETDRVCAQVWGLASEGVAELADEAREASAAPGAEPRYERWRELIRRHHARVAY